MTDEQYQYLLARPEWKKKREEILERDHYHCRNCDATDHLEVHHRQYHVSSMTGEKLPPWQYDNHYLITLCNHCHQKGHEKYQVPVFTVNR